MTHDQEEALAMSDRIAVMNEGVVEQVASPCRLYERPVTSFCADFIGSLNALEFRVDDVNGRRRRARLRDRTPGRGGREWVQARRRAQARGQAGANPHRPLWPSGAGGGLDSKASSPR